MLLKELVAITEGPKWFIVQYKSRTENRWIDSDKGATPDEEKAKQEEKDLKAKGYETRIDRT